MKASFFNTPGEPSVLIYGDQPDPVLKPNEVLVRIKAAGLNHVDIWVRKGGPAYPVTVPHITGADGAGVIESVGSQVEGVSVGDRVLVFPALSCGVCAMCKMGKDNQCDKFEILGAKRWGTYAEFVAVPDDSLMVLPDSFSFEDAASFGVAAGTAWHMINGRAKLQKNETVLILGGGSGVGSSAIQISKMLGAKILALTTDESKVEKIQALGAHHVHVIGKEAKFSTWVMEQTDGKGVDVVVEHVGPATWEESLKSLMKTGRLVTCGATTGPTVNLDLRFLFSRSLTLLGARWSTKKEFQVLANHYFSGKLKPTIDKTFPLSQAAEAHEFLESGGQMGKVVLKV